jgi:hypothetical protein
MLIFIWVAYIAAFAFISGKWEGFRKEHPAIRSGLANGWSNLSSRAKLGWIAFAAYLSAGWFLAYLVTGDAGDAIFFPIMIAIVALQAWGLSLLMWRGIRRLGRGISRITRKQPRCPH